ncbi:50S ribosomal protein L10 [Rhodotorula toruloides]|uniref:50S ribosomal protein L10 n=1 Tax=Rhodotorula toruloides TaxID=5286 RepID=A0A511KNS0_RHOTO|nr:50S ribosomal protein L10 [Rhodotorula toruloides]
MVQPGHVRWAQAAARPTRSTRALPAHKELAYRRHAHLLTANDVVLFLRPGEFNAHEWGTLRAQLAALSANPADPSTPPLKLTVLRPGLLSPLVRAAQPRDPKAKKPKHQQQSLQLSDAAREALAALDFSLINDRSHTSGPIAVVTSPSLHPPTLSKVLALVNKFSQTPNPNRPAPGPKDPPVERLAILSSLVERQAATLERTEEVGKLPSLDTLRAQLVGLLSAPGARITGVVGARAQEIGRALEGFKLGLEEQGKPKAEGGKKKRVDAPASVPAQPPPAVNKLKRPPPALPADGSPAPPPEPPIPPDGSVKTCEAVDRYDEVCGEVVVGGWKGKVPRRWCQMHEDEEKFVRASFWNSVSSLPRLARTHPLPSPTEITSSTSFTELEGWETIARQHMDLAKRAYDSWVFHRTHFFAAGGDLVDRLEGRGEGEGGTDLARGAWEEVRLRGEKAEAVLKLIIRRSHFLVCDAEDALWLLHPQSRCTHATANGYDSSSLQSSCECSHDASYCNHGDDDGLHGSENHISPPNQAAHNPLRPPGSPTLAPESEEPDPLVALDTLRRTELLELLSLTGSHASFIREGRKSVERVRIVECLFRRLISRDEELLVKAYRGGHDHVLRFFEDPALVTLPALARLHRALQRTSPLELKEAIMDAFRAIAWEESGATETEEGEEGVGMQVLGGWLYRYQLGRSMTPREWSHLYDLCACPGCATTCCQRFTDLALIRRLTVVPHGPHPPPFESWTRPGETDAKKVFKALDVVWCAGKEKDDVRKVRKMTQPGMGIGMGAETVWAARQERNWAFLKLSLTHPHALSILTLLSQFFTLLVRSRLTPAHPLPSFPLPPHAHLWTHRLRTAPTKAALSRPPSPSTSSSSSLAVSAPSPSTHPWRALPNPFNLSHSPAHILAGFDAFDSPEKEQDMPPFDGTYELLVLDAPSDSPYAFVEAYIPRPLAAFENFLASVIASACGIKVPGVTVFDEDVAASNEADSRAAAEKQGMDMPALLQAALEHGAVESFLAGDLVWDFGDVKGVTTPFSPSTGGTGGKRFSGVDLKKVGKNGIVAPPMPIPAAPATNNNGANGAVGSAGKKGGAGVKNAKGAAAGAATTDKEKKAKALDGLRDDSLALRLARSLFVS